MLKICYLNINIFVELLNFSKYFSDLIHFYTKKKPDTSYKTLEKLSFYNYHIS